MMPNNSGLKLVIIGASFGFVVGTAIYVLGLINFGRKRRDGSTSEKNSDETVLDAKHFNSDKEIIADTDSDGRPYRIVEMMSDCHSLGSTYESPSDSGASSPEPVIIWGPKHKDSMETVDSFASKMLKKEAKKVVPLGFQASDFWICKGCINCINEVELTSPEPKDVVQELLTELVEKVSEKSIQNKVAPFGFQAVAGYTSHCSDFECNQQCKGCVKCCSWRCSGCRNCMSSYSAYELKEAKVAFNPAQSDPHIEPCATLDHCANPPWTAWWKKDEADQLDVEMRSDITLDTLGPTFISSSESDIAVLEHVQKDVEFVDKDEKVEDECDEN